MTTASAEVPAELRVVRTIRALKASRGVSTEVLQAQIGISRSTWFDKMRSGQFTVGEVVALADYFGVTVQSLIDGQVTVTTIARNFRVIDGGGRTSGINRPILNIDLTND